MTKYLAIALVLAGCGDNKNPPGNNPEPDAAAGPRAVVVSGDFAATGVMSVLDLGTMEVTQRVAPNGAIGTDPVLRKIGDELFVVNRNDGNNITILDATTFAVKEQLATGANSNPNDVALVGNKLYVPTFAGKGVVVLTRGTTTTTVIDLSQFDTDGVPNCIAATAVGNDVYVACERLDANFKPRGVGTIAVIDTATDTLRTSVNLTTANPIGTLETLPNGDLVIATAPQIITDPTAGCVESITPGATPKANGCVVTNADLGGFVNRIEVQDTASFKIAWMVTSNFPMGYVEAFDLETKCLWAAPVTPSSQAIVDIVSCPNLQLVVADAVMDQPTGLRVYEGSAEKTTAPLDIGIKPASTRGLVCY
jgi:hypothetical protein